MERIFKSSRYDNGKITNFKSVEKDESEASIEKAEEIEDKDIEEESFKKKVIEK